MSEWKHGTHGTYVNGCRCERCRLASNTYKRARYHATLADSRRKCREKMRRYATARHQPSTAQINDPDMHLIRTAAALHFYREHSTGELRELIEQQARDDTYYMGRHPLISFSLQDPLYKSDTGGNTRGGYEF